MKINSTKFKGLKIINFQSYKDIRGRLTKTFNNKYKSVKFRCFESYISVSRKGTIRGLHGQVGKYSQKKLIFCISGRALDISIDLRKNSKTFGKIFKKILDSKNFTGLIIPKGFVHGVIILKKNTTLITYCSSPYNPKKEFGVNINSIKLKLPKMKFFVSKKDKNLIDLNTLIKNKN